MTRRRRVGNATGMRRRLPTREDDGEWSKYSKSDFHQWQSVPGHSSSRPIRMTIGAFPANFPEAGQEAAPSGPYYSSRRSTHGAQPHQR
jgi:hypothetical protein